MKVIFSVNRASSDEQGFSFYLDGEMCNLKVCIDSWTMAKDLAERSRA